MQHQPKILKEYNYNNNEHNFNNNNYKKMQKETIKLLQKYLSNATELDFSRQNIYNKIEGILDLSKFASLQKLNCSYNRITELINLPNGLISLNCSFNMIIELKNLPVTLKELDCNSNSIKNLDNLPDSLEKLNCSHNHIKLLEYLPSFLKELDCSHNIITDFQLLPVSLEILTCGTNNFHCINNFTSIAINLKKINLYDSIITSQLKFYIDKQTGLTPLKILNCNFASITKLENLPEGIENLNCSSNLMKILVKLPKTLKILNCSYCCNLELLELPPNLEILYCHSDIIKTLNTLPKSIKINKF